MHVYLPFHLHRYTARQARASTRHSTTQALIVLWNRHTCVNDTGSRHTCVTDTGNRHTSLLAHVWTHVSIGTCIDTRLYWHMHRHTCMDPRLPARQAWASPTRCSSCSTATSSTAPTRTAPSPAPRPEPSPAPTTSASALTCAALVSSCLRNSPRSAITSQPIAPRNAIISQPIAGPRPHPPPTAPPRPAAPPPAQTHPARRQQARRQRGGGGVRLGFAGRRWGGGRAGRAGGQERRGGDGDAGRRRLGPGGEVRRGRADEQAAASS
jgi:hypothetical protein